MKIKEQTIKELDGMNPAQMMIIYGHPLFCSSHFPAK
jgi:hypothetical protein